MVNILGTPYNIVRVKCGEDEHMDSNGLCGYCVSIEQKIVILDLTTAPDWKNDSAETREKQEKETMRHEIIHAFLNESGLQASALASDCWARNEEMVDWFAIQSPKLFSARIKIVQSKMRCTTQIQDKTPLKQRRAPLCPQSRVNTTNSSSRMPSVM